MSEASSKSIAPVSKGTEPEKACCWRQISDRTTADPWTIAKNSLVPASGTIIRKTTRTTESTHINWTGATTSEKEELHWIDCEAVTNAPMDGISAEGAIDGRRRKGFLDLIEEEGTLHRRGRPTESRIVVDHLRQKRRREEDD
ncbi:hypothetical protein KSP39_PZI004355 [Platanthera zijinensis]|uniref:Uncharacterized protein n=1 Tax=Platanthera zijinensis TaxID=2320716 RepID=A0AAP0BWM2_9ASPA